MDKNDEPQSAYSDVYKLSPEIVLELFTNELRHSTASIGACVQLLEKIVLPEVISSKQTLEKVIEIVQWHIDRIEALRHNNYLYLEKRNKS